jgi:hypothetical protein
MRAEFEQESLTDKELFDKLTKKCDQDYQRIKGLLEQL